MGIEKRIEAQRWFDFLRNLQKDPINLWAEDVSKVFSLINRYRPEDIICKIVNGIPVTVFINSTKRGPALGGTRRLIYRDMSNFLRDGLKLSAAMTYKAIWARVPLGGGKAVIYGSAEEINDDFAQAFADFLNGINTPRERFFTGEDIGFGEDFVDKVAKDTKYISGKSVTAGGLGDPSPMTAEGIFLATKAIIEDGSIFSGTLQGKIMAVQGAGKVALPLIKRLLSAGARVCFSEPNEQRAAMAESLGAQRVDMDKIFGVPCHIFMPCAIGGVINKDTIPKLSWMCRVVAGAANNILDTPEDGVELHKRRIYFAPDYVVNRWGLEWVNQEKSGVTDLLQAKRNLTDIVHDILNIFLLSKDKNLATSEITDAISQKVLAMEDESIEHAIDAIWGEE